jgi:hypothetical protein
VTRMVEGIRNYLLEDPNPTRSGVSGRMQEIVNYASSDGFPLDNQKVMELLAEGL